MRVDVDIIIFFKYCPPLHLSHMASFNWNQMDTVGTNHSHAEVCQQHASLKLTVRYPPTSGLGTSGEDSHWTVAEMPQVFGIYWNQPVKQPKCKGQEIWMYFCVFTVQGDILWVDCDCFPTVCALPTEYGFYLRHSTANRAGNSIPLSSMWNCSRTWPHYYKNQQK